MRGKCGVSRDVLGVTVPPSQELRLGGIPYPFPFLQHCIIKNTTLRRQNATSARLHTPTFPVPSLDASLTPCANAIANFELPPWLPTGALCVSVLAGSDRLHPEVKALRLQSRLLPPAPVPSNRSACGELAALSHHGSGHQRGAARPVGRIKV